ncbi:4'-phosphopantetheinyl transferase family protein [Nocardia callitridis]|uniref:Uncharacterized protein n=1 Tax=Nocardia callitridis TaxID=648753 RepID=A0ABP9KAS8_9NOCA
MTSNRLPRVRITVAPRHDEQNTSSRDVRSLLRHDAEYHGIPSACEVRNSSSGAPFLTHSSQQVSLTHDLHWMAAATSPVPIGIDIQQQTRVTDRFRRRLGCGTVREATRSWSVREAISKLRARGLADAPWRYRIDAPRNEIGTFEEAHWQCVRVGFDVFLAVAAECPVELVLRGATP